MSAPCFTVSAFVYGYHDVRLEADVVIPIEPSSLAQDSEALGIWVKKKFNLILPDLKYCYPMTCEFCNKPARENFLNFASWPHLPPKGQMWRGKPSPGPSGTAYIHAVCTMGGRCGRKAQGMSDWMAMMSINTGTAPEKADIGPKQDYYNGEVFPRNGSCGHCATDASVDLPLSKCSVCKTTVYCGDACQKADWSRHKRTCKWIKGTRLVDSEGNVTTWKQNPEPSSRHS